MSGLKPIKKIALAWLFVLGFFIMAPALALATDNTYKRLDEWQYTVIHQVVVENPGSTEARDIYVTVPLMDKSCHAYQSCLGALSFRFFCQ